MRVMLCGPIEHWWDDNWGTEAHNDYVDWRQQVSDALVAAGHLVYRPHEAFKGQWDDNDGDKFSQPVNDAALRGSHLVLFLTPDDVPSEGCDGELQLCVREEIHWLFAPP